MGVRLHTSLPDIESLSGAIMQIAENRYIRGLHYFGQECVTYVRDRSSEDSWIDRTGNLRSSIGYMIAKGGKVIGCGGFEPTRAPKGDGHEGQRTGKEFAETVVRLTAGDFTLTIVAGMNYADEVEAIEGKDVLAGCELWVRKEFPKFEKKLKADIETEIQKVMQRYEI